jgi:hypothetical protein
VTFCAPPSTPAMMGGSPKTPPNSVILSGAKDLPRQCVFIDFAGCSFCFDGPLTACFFQNDSLFKCRTPT